MMYEKLVRKRAWQELKAFFAERRRIKVPQTGRDWTRDELYEDRLARWGPKDLYDEAGRPLNQSIADC